MALLSVEVVGNFTLPIKKLISLVPDLNGGFLSLVGSRARTLLKMKYLSGQELNMFEGSIWANGLDSRGRYLIVSDVNKKRDTVKIYSYTANLFEKGRKLRDGSTEKGKYIIAKKLKQSVMAGMGSYTRDYDRYMQRELDKI